MPISELRAFLNQVLEETTQDQRERALRGKQVAVRNAKGPGFGSAVTFYLFRCDACKQLSVDYLHGFEERQYLTCQNCSQ